VGGCGNTIGHWGYASQVADKCFTFAMLSEDADLLGAGSTGIGTELERTPGILHGHTLDDVPFVEEHIAAFV